MKVLYEDLGKNLPNEYKLCVPVTYCLNCDNPIRYNGDQLKEFCSIDCEIDYEELMKDVMGIDENFDEDLISELG